MKIIEAKIIGIEKLKNNMSREYKFKKIPNGLYKFIAKLLIRIEQNEVRNMQEIISDAIRDARRHQILFDEKKLVKTIVDYYGNGREVEE